MVKSDSFKRYLQFTILIIAAGAIYPLVYLRTSFQTPMLQAFNIDISQLSNLYAMLGSMFIIGYFPSGWLADKISAKKLISFSLIVTGILGFVFATYPGTKILYAVFFGWGISTVFTFWSALIKAVKMLAKKEEQARFFGILDGGRGVVEALLGTIAMIIFSYFLGDSKDSYSIQLSLKKVIYMYSFSCIFLSILVFFFLDAKDEIEKKAEKSNVIESLKLIIIKPEIWLMSLIIFCGYVLYWTIYYLSGYLTTNHEVSSVTAGYISVLILWMRPLGGIGGGFLGDKFGKENVLALSMILASTTLLFLGLSFKNITLLGIYIGVVFIGLMLYFIRGLYWSLLDECDIPNTSLGIAIGLISFVGYLPDIFIPIFSNNIFSKFNDGPEAYNIYFLTSALIGVVGAILSIYFKLKTKKKVSDELILEK
ncbi:MAG: MFS transporter [Cetobacterium sp.]